eukprot:sb/3463370/
MQSTVQQQQHQETGPPGLVAHLSTTPSDTTLAPTPIPGEVDLPTDRETRLLRRNEMKEILHRDRKEEADVTTDIDTLIEKSAIDILIEDVDELMSATRREMSMSTPKDAMFAPSAISTPMRKRLSLPCNTAPRMLSVGTQTETHNTVSLPLHTDDTPRTVAAAATGPTPTNTGPTPTSIDPVRVLCSINIDDDISPESVTAGLHLDREGTRYVCSFGPENYTYGGKSHTAQPFPASGIIPSIQAQLSTLIEGFSPTWSCLLNFYPSGESSIPFHSDDELEIEDDSEIVCVSIGQSRSLHFRSITGPKQSRVIELGNGSVYSMTKASQGHWEHSIPADGTMGSRVSLTFRKITPASTRTIVPPIREPTEVPVTPPKRVLILTDSIYNGLGAQLKWGKGVQVVYRRLYQLTHLEQYEHLFRDTDIVFISSGINDLSRYGERGYSLFNHIRPILSRLSSTYSDTLFVFNSVLDTAENRVGPWLNREINSTNNLIFDFSRSLPNLRFLDTHWSATKFWKAGGPPILSPRGNGIHLSLAAQTHLESIIRKSLLSFLFFECTERRCWDLRPEFWVRLGIPTHLRF